MTSIPASVQLETRAAWRKWLEAHHPQTEGVWLISYKKATGKPTMTYNERVEEALSFGWVDSKPGKVDSKRTRLYFAPRKPGSGWSKPNQVRAERMIALGQMTAAGHAKSDGSWYALDAVERLELPPDLITALAERGDARKNFEAFPRSVKRGILEWISNAKRPQTRAKRILETATLAEQNERANQWRGRRDSFSFGKL